MMLGRNLLKKIPQTAHQVFPKRFSRMAGFDGAEGEEENGGISKGFESGEELETFLRDELGFDGKIGNSNEGDTKKMLDDDFLGIRGAADRGKSKIAVETSEMTNNEKRWDLDSELSHKDINLEKLQRIASSGVPDGGDLRPTIWKLLLGYLPTSQDLWEKELAQSRMEYAKLKEEFLFTPGERGLIDMSDCSSKCDAGRSLERQEVSNEDHPLCLGKASVWQQYFEFAEISEQIDRDLERTHPTLKFFSEDSSPRNKNKKSMKNILLLFAKLNPEIRYVQGMNEILAPLYYVFSMDSDKNNCANAEADSFHCFVKLMSDLLDHYCEQLDNSSAGIHSTLLRLSELLKANDEELWRHLELKNKVSPQLYGFRWITLLLTQEFDFRTILRIWDSLLSNPLGVQEMLLRVCCAMLLSVKTRLLSGDFADNLQLLQHYPAEIDIECILKTAQDLTPA